jgi:hypothetical protein
VLGADTARSLEVRLGCEEAPLEVEIREWREDGDADQPKGRSYCAFRFAAFAI